MGLVALGIFDGTTEDDPRGLASILLALQPIADTYAWSAGFERDRAKDVPVLKEQAIAAEKAGLARFDDLMAIARVFDGIHDATFATVNNELLIESYGSPRTPWEIRCQTPDQQTILRLLKAANIVRVGDIPEG